MMQKETDDAGDKHVEALSEQIRGFEWWTLKTNGGINWCQTDLI